MKASLLSIAIWLPIARAPPANSHWYSSSKPYLRSTNAYSGPNAIAIFFGRSVRTR